MLYVETKSLRDKYPALRWVVPANYHVTVQFLGDLNERDVARVCGVMDSFPRLSAADLTVARMTTFPHRGPPKTIVAGLSSGSERCKQLRDLFASKVPEYLDERNYVPHITLARVPRRVPSPRLEMPLPDLNTMFTASSLVLFESVLRPHGPIYRCVHSLVLG